MAWTAQQVNLFIQACQGGVWSDVAALIQGELIDTDNAIAADRARLTALEVPLAFSYPNRQLGVQFQPSGTRDTWCNYLIELGNTSNLIIPLSSASCQLLSGVGVIDETLRQVTATLSLGEKIRVSLGGIIQRGNTALLSPTVSGGGSVTLIRSSEISL